MHTRTLQTGNQKELLMSYNTLRKLLGTLGVALPIVLIAGSVALHGSVLRSISAYYYSPMRDLLVAAFCSIGLFLFTYKGYKDKDELISENIITNCAGTMAACVALLPTSFQDYSLDNVCTSNHIPCCWNIFGVIDNFDIPNNPQCTLLSTTHLVAAILFFALVAYLSIFRFTKITDDQNDRRREIKLYKVCGYIIVACIIVMGLDAAANKKWTYDNVEIALHWFPVLFTFESIALWAFGIAWLTKGKLHVDIKNAAAFLRKGHKPQGKLPG